MKPYLVIICLSILLASSAFAADDSKPNSSVENEPVAPVINDETIKQKRGIIGHSAFPYTPVPSIGLHRYPIAKVAQYHITPGSAASYSYSINYPKVLHPRPFYRHAFLPAPAPYPVHAPAPYPVHAPAPVPSPVLFHNRPILQAPAPAHIPFSLYGERYPVLAHKPITPIEAPFSYAPPVVHSNILPPVNSDAFGLRPHIIPNAIPHSTIVSQDGWRPLSTPIHTPTISVHSAKPAINILPPIATQHSAGGGLVQRPSNFYLPVDTPQFQDATPHSHEALIHADEHFHHDLNHHHDLSHQHDFQEQLQQLQHTQNFLRSQYNEGPITPLSEQGYEPASNNGRYIGRSSYDVPLNSRGL